MFDVFGISSEDWEQITDFRMFFISLRHCTLILAARLLWAPF